MNKRLPRNFYTQPTLKVAKQMLGKYLIHKHGKKKLVGKIVETEAYIGPKDKASHAFEGKITKRNKAVYLIGGHIYIYLVYGMYWQLNISTAKEGRPECVLIRALEPILEKSTKSQAPNHKQIQNPRLRRGFGGQAKSKIQNIANGPGKLCRWMGFDKSHYGIDVVTSKKIYLTEGESVKLNQIVASKRIGIDYAQEWADKPWRFYIEDSKFISKT